jgi:hypothetical protein
VRCTITLADGAEPYLDMDLVRDDVVRRLRFWSPDGQTSMTVFLLEHVHEWRDGHEDVKLIGVYSTVAAAQRGLDMVKSQPGFSECPGGFSINEHTLDHTSWLEGYVTISHGEEQAD